MRVIVDPFEEERANGYPRLDDDTPGNCIPYAGMPIFLWPGTGHGRRTVAAAELP